MTRCKICQHDFETIEKLHSHVKKEEKIFLKDYYTQYSAKHDLLNGEIIPYSGPSYFDKNFNSWENFILWKKTVSNKKFLGYYAIAQLKKRIEEKKPKYIFSQAELSSTYCVDLSLWDKFSKIEKYIDYCRKAGLEDRFDYNQKPEIVKGLSSIKIDTREKKPWDFPFSTQSSKLDVGDYSGNLFKNIVVERKSIVDLCGTFSSGYNRFENEVSLANKMGIYVVVIVEGCYSEALGFKTNFTKITGKNVFRKIRKFSQNHKNIQFLFGNNVPECKRLCRLALSMKNIRYIDLQWNYEKGFL